MSKATSRGQALQISARVGTQVHWDELDGENLQNEVIDLSSEEFGKRFTLFLKNGARIQIIGEHIIDCDATPFAPDGLTIHSHKKGGKIHWCPTNFKLWLHPKQQSGGDIHGYDWLEWMKSKPVYNANVLDYWLAHPEIIPAECKGKWTYFPGTVYRDSFDDLCVRCLDWSGEYPISRCRWLDDCWSARGPAAGSAS